MSRSKLDRQDDGSQQSILNLEVADLEYEVHGTVLATRVKYNNRFCSIVKIENRKIAHWRDYMDSLAAWKALTAQAQ